jgi:hypothetical protein
LIDFRCAALPADKLWNRTADGKPQRLLGIVFMCSDSGNRSRTRKDSHGQLLEECLSLAFTSTAEHVAYFRRPHGAQLDMDAGHEVSFRK